MELVQPLEQALRESPLLSLFLGAILAFPVGALFRFLRSLFLSAPVELHKKAAARRSFVLRRFHEIARERGDPHALTALLIYRAVRYLSAVISTFSFIIAYSLLVLATPSSATLIAALVVACMLFLAMYWVSVEKRYISETYRFYCSDTLVRAEAEYYVEARGGPQPSAAN